VYERLDTYRAHLDTIGMDPEQLGGEPSATISPSPAYRGSPLATLPEMRIEGAKEADQPAELRLGDPLGIGAMGVVRSGVQISLDRSVAVKQVRPERNDPEARMELLREAWVTGRLEHPNIVPVYALGRSLDDEPMFTMKRIEGTRWTELIQEPQEHVAVVGDDPLGFHLGVLEQVCNAVGFAHARGVLHRDLKPDNVMIGSFGEVYVLDWGIAVALEGGESDRLPAAADVYQVAGTPAYMAPEMAAADPESIGVHSDIYLLGAVLYEVLTGDMIHPGRDVVEVLAHAYLSPPVFFGPEVLPELADVCRTATATEPKDRYPTAAALRQALVEVRRHRASIELAAHASERLGALERLLAATESDVAEVRTAAAEARYGFGEALRSWPDNAAARVGLQRTLVCTIDHLLTVGDLAGARSLLGQLPEQDGALLVRVAALEAERAGVQEKLQELDQRRADEDMGVTARNRVVTSWFMALLAGGLCFFLGSLERFGLEPAGFGEMQVMVAVLGFFGVVDAFSVRWSAPNRVARRMSALLVVALLVVNVHWLAARAMGLSFEGAVASTALLVGGLLGIGAVALHRDYLLPACAFGGAFFAMLLWPALCLEVLGVAAAVAFARVAMMSREGAADPLI
jgi:eukaryotic-like serine/threonine-protein kinase